MNQTETIIMKQFANMTQLESLLLATKKIAGLETELALYRRVVLDATTSIEQLERDAKNPKKRSREESTPIEVAKVKKCRTMTYEEAMEFRMDCDKLDACNDGRMLLKVCRALKKISREDMEKLRWTTQEKKRYIATNEEPVPRQVAAVEDSDSDDEDYHTSEAEKASEEEKAALRGKKFKAIEVGMDKAHDLSRFLQ